MVHLVSGAKARNPTRIELLQTLRNESSPSQSSQQPVLHVPPRDAGENDEEAEKRKATKSAVHVKL